MSTEDGGTLKLIKGEASGPTRTVRRRTTTRRSVTRRTPERDPVAEVLEHLDEEPVDAPARAEKRVLAPDEVVDDADDADENQDDDTDDSQADDAEADDRDPADRTGGTDRGTAARDRRPKRQLDRRRQAALRRRPAPRAERPRRRPDRTTVILLAALCLSLAAGIVFGSRWYGDRQLDRAHQQAVAAAKQTTVDFVSVSAGSVDRDLQRIVAGSTGDFRDEFTRGQSQVRAAVIENNVDSRGTVLRAALLSGDRRHAVVLVAVDATVKNAKAPDGRQSHYRIQVELNRSGSGRWLVSRLQFVG